MTMIKTNNDSLAHNRVRAGDRERSIEVADAFPPQNLAQLQAAFSIALLDPTCAIPQGLVGPDGYPSVKRFNVYRNNVIAGLTGSLKDAYPAVARIVGDEFFTSIARTYVTVNPPTSPIMLSYGEGFPSFIGAFEPAIGSLPYLGDVARLERDWLEAYHSPDAQALSADSLAAFNADDLMNLRVTLHPSLRIVRSEFPVLSIWNTNIPAGVPTWIDIYSGGQDVLLNRPDVDVEARPLPPGGAAFIHALGNGLNAVEAADLALSADDRFDLGLNLVGLVTAGGLVEFDVTPSRASQ